MIDATGLNLTTRMIRTATYGSKKDIKYTEFESGSTMHPSISQATLENAILLEETVIANKKLHNVRSAHKFLSVEDPSVVID